MNCPRCERFHLDELDRDGVTIDRCESCRGIWLDRGELEKLMARARPAPAARTERVDRTSRTERRDHDDDDHDDDRGRHGKRSWWEIFD